MKGLLTKPPPPGDAINPLRECQALLAEASSYAKQLRVFDESVQRFNKSADTLLATSVGVVGTSLEPTTTEQIRGGLRSEMDAGVLKPIASWLAEYKQVKQEVKALERLGGDFGSSLAAVGKANAKKIKAEETNAKQEKQDKISASLHVKQQALDSARQTYLSVAPTTQMKCRQLLQARDDLRMRLYSTFDISSGSFHRMAELKSHDSAPSAYPTTSVPTTYPTTGYHSPSQDPSTPTRVTALNSQTQPYGLQYPENYHANHELPPNAAMASEASPPYPPPLQGFGADGFSGASPFYAGQRQESEDEKTRPYPAYP